MASVTRRGQAVRYRTPERLSRGGRSLSIVQPAGEPALPKPHLRTLALVLPLLAVGAARAEDVPVLANTCQACHGASGQPIQPAYPIIAGQNAPYLQAALHAYREGLRATEQGALMTAIAANLTDADIATLAEFFSKLRNLR